MSTDKDKSRTSGEEPPPPQSLDALTLFAGRKEIRLDLRGESYRLRITRRGRLILTK